MEMPSTPEQLQTLADNIRERVESLSDVETVLQQSAGDIARAKTLLDEAKKARYQFFLLPLALKQAVFFTFQQNPRRLYLCSEKHSVFNKHVEKLGVSLACCIFFEKANPKESFLRRVCLTQSFCN